MKKIIKRQLAPNQSAFLLRQGVMQNTAHTVRGAAFTLIELLVVIAIVGILSGIIIVAMSNSTDSATIAKGQVFASSLRNSLLNNLVTEWTFDNVSGTVDSVLSNGTTVSDSWGGASGTTAGAGPILRSGANCIYNKCLDFDGIDDYVNFGKPSSLLNWTKSSVILWARTSDVISGDQYMFYGGYWNSPYGDFIRVSSGNIGVGLWLSSGPTTPVTYAAKTNTWYMIAYSWDGNNVAFYVNGQQVSKTGPGLTGTLSRNTASNISVGGCASGYFKGRIDDVRLYNDSISISQIREQYLAGLSKLLARGEITKQEYAERLTALNSPLSGAMAEQISPSPNATVEQSQSYAEK